MNAARIAAVLCLSAGLTACSMAPRYARPEAAIPAAWPSGEAYPAASPADAPSHDWATVFSDGRLRALISAGLAANQDIRAAVATMAAARAQYAIQRAELLPVINAGGSYRRQDRGNGAVDAFSVDGTLASYEVDLFGRLRSLSDSDRSRYFASQAATRAARLTLIADIAVTWLTYAADRSLLATARDTADAARESLKLTRLRLDGGIAPRSDARQAEIVLRSAEADVASQTTAVAQDLNALRLLVGADIDPAHLPASIEDAAARIGAVGAGLDSAILLRRPDVEEAEWRLRAANAEIGAARAALFPRISLTGLLGFASDALSSLFDSGNFIWQAGGDASYAVFRGGAGRATVRLSEAQRDALLANYRLAVQSAFADVADALARRGTIDAQLTAATAGQAAAADNLRLADLRYRGGVDSYLQNLNARQARYTADRALIQTRLTAAANRVALYRALGADSSL